MGIVTLDQIRQARERIAGVARRTPLVPFPSPDGKPWLWLKLESFQPIGSFKLRGAYNKIASLAPSERSRGVITYSSGNHAQGVAYAARAVGVRAVVVMPNNAPPVKVQSTRALGAEIVVVGPASAERQQKAEELAAEQGLCVVPPYNDEQIIAGQGTMALEIMEELPDVDVILSPIGGGGLVSGIATAVKTSNAQAKVIGLEPELAGDARESFTTGKLAVWPATQTSLTIADGLRTQSVGPIPFEHIRQFVDNVITVSESEIRQAMRRIALEAHVIAEPSGAVTTAAALFARDRLPQAKKIVAIVSGGNADPGLLRDVIA